MSQCEADVPVDLSPFGRDQSGDRSINRKEVVDVMVYFSCKMRLGCNN
jgi:hypothetical protein